MTAARVVTARVAEILAPRRLIATANATLILYLLEVFLSLSVAALILQGRWQASCRVRRATHWSVSRC